MNCEESRLLLDAYVDNELDAFHVAQIEQHLRGCAGCSSDIASIRTLSSSIRSLQASEPRVPEALEKRIRSRAGGSSASRISHWLHWVPLAAALVIALFVGRSIWMQPGRELLDDAVNSHVRSLMQGHLIDIASSDRHTVKPWFAGKIDYSPPVQDFAAQGFPLAGGRLDYLGRRTVAVLVYKRRQHIINCYVWPAKGGNTNAVSESENGFNIERWRAAGIEYWLVSDLNAAELERLAALIRPTE